MEHPIDISTMTAEQAINATIEMWESMYKALGSTPSEVERTTYKAAWLKEHGYDLLSIRGNCFLCTWARRHAPGYVGCCHLCPIRWRRDCDNTYLSYLNSPLTEILDYLKNQDNWRSFSNDMED